MFRPNVLGLAYGSEVRGRGFVAFFIQQLHGAQCRSVGWQFLDGDVAGIVGFGGAGDFAVYVELEC